MKRTHLSLLSLAVALSVGACAKNNNNNNQRTKPVPGPTVTEDKPKEKKPVRRSTDSDDAPVKSKHTGENRDVVDPKPVESKPKIPDAPKPSTPEYAGKADKPGYVQSPYDAQHRLIDVRGLPPGTEAECPYTRRTFLVPP